MIELIYNEEGEFTTGQSKLLEPPNKKKIGEPKEYKKIFIEDYVHTYLLQQSTENVKCVKAAVLLGKTEKDRGCCHLYIRGALPIEQINEKQGKYCFTEKIWNEIYQNCEKYFPNQEIMGWFLSKQSVFEENTDVLEETHRTYFSGADKLLFVVETAEQKSTFWGFDGNRFAMQPGYFIYYEKNEWMREFLMEKNEQNPKGSEKPDVAVANFRKILKEKQAKNVKRKKQAVTYGVKVAIALVFFVGAVALKNQTAKIKMMKEQIDAFSEKTVLQETVSDEVIVEELPGNVEESQEMVYELPTVLEEPVIEETPVEEEVFAEEELPIEEAPNYEQYVVMAGDTLAKICREKYGTDDMIGQVCALNGISDGDYIQEGEIILLP